MHPFPLDRRRLALSVAAALALSPATALRAEPKRIVSIGGSITETVYALGFGDRLVAVDATSLYPEAATALPNIGYMRTLSAEPILALGPDLILADGDAGPAEVLEQIRGTGVPIVIIAKATAAAEVPNKIRAVARALEANGAGEALAESVGPSTAAISAAANAQPAKPRVLFLLSIGQGAPLAAGRDTAAAGIIAAAGGINAVDGYDGYKPVSPEATVVAAPDVILVTSRTVELMGGVDAILSLPDIRPTPAGVNRRLVVMDALLLLGFGPRIAEAIGELARALHPDADLPARG